MPTGAGSFDSEGIWQFGEADDETLMSDTLNLGQTSVSAAFTLDRARLDDLETVKPYLEVSDTAAFSVSSGPVTVTAWATTDRNIGGLASSFAAGVFTAPVSGIYHLSAIMTCSSAATSYFGILLLHSTKGFIAGNYSSTAATDTRSVATKIYLAAGETVTIQARRSVTGNIVDRRFIAIYEGN